MCGPGSGGHGWRHVHWGVRSVSAGGEAGRVEACIAGVPPGAATARRVGVRGGGRGVSGSGLAGRGWWASGCALLLRGGNAGETASLRAAYWGASIVVEATCAHVGGGCRGGWSAERATG